MRIFQASITDVPRMMQCAKDCCSEHGEEALGGPFNPEHYEAAWKVLLHSGSGVMFLVEKECGTIVGGIGGVKSPVMLTGKMRAFQLFWYMSPQYRAGLTAIRLFDRFEQWAKDQGCTQVTQPILDSMSKNAGKIFGRRGYEVQETIFRKTL